MYPFKEGSFAVRNAWYVAAFSEEINRDLVSRTILNEPVVLYRKEDGEAVAVGGRCPHRHFPLGKSCLKGDAIICGYHGIAFGSDGQCLDIPSQAHVPRTYSIPTYPLIEHGIWLFIWMGDKGKADVSLLPDLGEIGLFEEDMVARPFFVDHVDGRYQLLNDNLLDLSHLAYLHGSSIGTVENASVPEIIVKKPGFLSSRRYINDVSAPPMMEHNGYYAGNVDRIVGMDFYLPGFHAGIGDTSYPKDHPEHPGKSIIVSRIYHAVTPATHKSCTYFFAMGSNDQEALDKMMTYIRPVVDEDKFATEEIEKMLAKTGENPEELLIKSDRNAVEGRRMLQAMMDAEAQSCVLAEQ